MHIRPATDQDIPSIVQLLKLSLGESLMPKSEAFWRWKHLDNPFGKSPVLLAFEQDQLIGVRAFMRWEWSKDNEMIKAVRAVDTATHPAHQGKGIFTKLTQQLVEECKAEGIGFIFNTPNKISQPGYLKMGWQSTGRLPVKFKFHIHAISRKQHASKNWNDVNNAFEAIGNRNTGNKIKTHQSPAYLFWRYRDNPNVKYTVLLSKDNQPFILIYRKRKIKWMTEVRITEWLCRDEHMSVALQALKEEEPASLITVSGTHPASGFLAWSAGPEVTIRNLNLPAWSESLTFENWSPSLGDLELF